MQAVSINLNIYSILKPMHTTKPNIIVGITGGIAAYKSCELVRLLRKQGYAVRVVMTKNAQKFIGPMTLQAISGNPVHTGLFDSQSEAAMDHITLARWADNIIVAPASADFIAKHAHGIADDLLTTICLASQAKLIIAPAMNQQMWSHPATTANVELLTQRKITILGPAFGDQACGEIGPGRMLEPEKIIDQLTPDPTNSLLRAQRIVITAGPTIEMIDPARYITNASTGKMGYALAQAAKWAGAEVILISGKTHLTPPSGIKTIQVTSANEMQQQVLAEATSANIVIGCAAVSDYRVKKIEQEKIKKTANEIALQLVKNPDIIADVAQLTPKPFTVGFAAESRELATHAKQKLANKQLDLIFANLINQENSGFAADHNEVWAYWNNGEKHFPTQTKIKLAQQLIELIAKLMPQRRS